MPRGHRPMTRHDLVLAPLGLRFLGRTYPCAIGRGGLSPAKREGDGATPAGVLHITGCLYRPDRLPRPAPRSSVALVLAMTSIGWESA